MLVFPKERFFLPIAVSPSEGGARAVDAVRALLTWDHWSTPLLPPSTAKHTAGPFCGCIPVKCLLAAVGEFGAKMRGNPPPPPPTPPSSHVTIDCWMRQWCWVLSQCRLSALSLSLAHLVSHAEHTNHLFLAPVRRFPPCQRPTPCTCALPPLWRTSCASVFTPSMGGGRSGLPSWHPSGC